MTRAEISTLILSWLDDEQQGYFSATDVNTWINLAQRQVQMELLQAGNNWYDIVVETLTVVNQQDYVLPTDFMNAHRLEIVMSGTGVNEVRKEILSITMNQCQGIPMGPGTPDYFYMKKDRITIWPAPSQALTLRLYYAYRVADLANNTDVPDVPEQYMEYLAILAAFDGFIKDDRAPENLIIKKTKYEALLKKSAIDRAQDHSRFVNSSLAYDIGSLF